MLRRATGCRSHWQSSTGVGSPTSCTLLSAAMRQERALLDYRSVSPARCQASCSLPAHTESRVYSISHRSDGCTRIPGASLRPEMGLSQHARTPEIRMLPGAEMTTLSSFFPPRYRNADAHKTY